MNFSDWMITTSNHTELLSLAVPTVLSWQEDEALDALNDLLVGMKEDALVMNDQLSEQKQMLNHLDEQMERTNERLKKDTRRIQRLR